MARLLILMLFVMFSGLPIPLWVRPATHTITTCSERDLDQALAVVQNQDVINFSCSDTITLKRSKVITRSITIDGSGQKVVLDGRRRIPIFLIEPKTSVTIKRLRIINGRGQSGGGGVNNRGELAIVDSTFSGNTHAVSNFAKMTVTNTTFADNDGVGIYNQSQLTVTGGTFTGNTHGIDNANGTLTVTNSTFARNKFMHRDGIGAGIANSGKVKVYNSTFADNEATSGAGIGNHLNGTVTIYNTLLANNGTGGNCFGPIIDGGNNLQYPDTSCGNTIPVKDPKIQPLAENGGTTQTIAVPSDSPAVGAGNAEFCPQVDQRGKERRKDCAIGAYEPS